MIESYAALGTLLLGVVSLFISVRRSVRNDKAARLKQAENERLDAIAAAERPLREKIAELQAANIQALEAQAAVWQGRLTDRDQSLKERTEERDHYRNLWDNRDQSGRGVNLAKPKDR